MKFSTVRTPSANATATAIVPLHEHPDLAEITAKIRSFKARLLQAEERRGRAQKASTAAQVAPPSHNAVDRAALLVGGGHIPSAEPSAEIRAADAEVGILKAGIGELMAVKAEIESRLSLEVSQAFAPQNRAAFIRLDEAIGEAHAAFHEVHDIHAKLQAAGYMPSQFALPSYMPAALYALGDPNNFGRSQAALFRAWVRKTFGNS